VIEQAVILSAFKGNHPTT